jgi:hypothetical protein
MKKLLVTIVIGLFFTGVVWAGPPADRSPCRWTSNGIECDGNRDGTADLLINKSDGTVEINGALYAVGGVSSASGAYTLGAGGTNENADVLWIATGPADITITASAGYKGCLVQGQGNTDALIINPGTGNYFVVDGVRQTQGFDFVSTGAAADKVCWECYDNTDIYIMSKSGTWATNSCPAYALDDNVVFAWNGDHDSGTNYGCSGSAVAVEGTNTSLTITDSYGESSSNGALCDTVNQNLLWADTGDQYIDDVGPQTICARIYIEAGVTSNGLNFFEGSDGTADNHLKMWLNSSDTTQGRYVGNTNSDFCTGTAATQDDWITVCYSWDQANGDHSFYPGNPEDEDTYDATEWREETDELGDTMAANMTEFLIGEYRAGGSEDDTATIYVDRIVLMDGYEAAPPTHWED